MGSALYIDGQAGTTALRIRDWLAGREDIELITLPDHLRKDDDARKQAVLSSDLSILCLPDDAAKQVNEWVKGTDTRVIDASTAHRVDPAWIYGLPEMQPDQREKIANAKLVSNPGCYSSSTILLLRPLLDTGILSMEAPVSIHAVSGYSGGGRALIEKWQKSALSDLPYEAPYAFDWKHKHIPEMQKYCGLIYEPQFVPAVGSFYNGMRVQIPLHTRQLKSLSSQDIVSIYQERYGSEFFLRLHGFDQDEIKDEFSFDPRVCNNTNRIELHVLGHPDGHVTLMAILDNLGKGASGMAIQSLNLMLGVPENTSLPVG